MRLAFRCFVRIAVLVQRSEMLARVSSRIMPRVFLSTEVRRSTCTHSCCYYLEKVTLERRAMQFIVFSNTRRSYHRRRDHTMN